MYMIQKFILTGEKRKCSGEDTPSNGYECAILLPSTGTTGAEARVSEIRA